MVVLKPKVWRVGGHIQDCELRYECQTSNKKLGYFSAEHLLQKTQSGAFALDITVCPEEQILSCDQHDTNAAAGCENQEEEEFTMIEESSSGQLQLMRQFGSILCQIAAVGSCCLVGVICSGNLYIANLGDSRAVLGRLVKATGEVLPIQLSSEHNVCIESVGQELHSEHPDDSQMVVLKPNVCRVRGLIQGAIIPSVLSSRTISKTNNELRTINLSAPIAVARSVHYTGVVGNSRTRTCIEMWRMAAGRKRWRRAGRKPGRGAGKVKRDCDHTS